MVLAIADNQADLIRSTIIDFSLELKESFGHVLKDIKDNSLSWAYPNQSFFPTGGMKVPDDVIDIASTIKNINGESTLQGTFNVWVALMRLPLPFPSFHRLISAVYAYWNTSKGGSDTSTFLMDGQITQIPKPFVNAETVSMCRLYMLVYVLVHRCLQVSTADENLCYDSLLHYRNAANARYSFHRTLIECLSVFEVSLEDHIPSAGNVPSTPTRNSTDRMRPIRQTIDGLVQTRINFEPVLASGTPQTQRQFRGSHASREVRNMITECHGIPVKGYPAKSNNKCHHCGEKTSWYCIGCKRWLCLEKRDVKRKKAHSYMQLYCRTDSKNRTKHYQKLCFHYAHEEVWRKISDARTNESLDTTVDI